jgi:hypothetical protein
MNVIQGGCLMASSVTPVSECCGVPHTVLNPSPPLRMAVLNTQQAPAPPKPPSVILPRVNAKMPPPAPNTPEAAAAAAAAVADDPNVRTNNACPPVRSDAVSHTPSQCKMNLSICVNQDLASRQRPRAARPPTGSAVVVGLAAANGAEGGAVRGVRVHGQR